jgi:hypothetical protein
MNSVMSLLAAAAAAAQPSAPNHPPVTPPVPPPGAPEQAIPPAFLGRLPMEDIWQFITQINWLQAAGLIAFGAIYLIYGWRIFKALVVINFGMIGLGAGILIGRNLGSQLWGGIMGTAILASISWPFMRYSVAVLGAGAGAVLGSALWRTFSLPEPLIWCGALFGLIAGGTIAFSSFKTSIMTFTSLQGSALVVMGILALLNGYPNMSERLTSAVFNHVFLLPVLLIVPTAAGIFFQQKLLKGEGEWAMPE